ncbi:uncharacterized protein LY89DRAFT_735234 [Mollisia scopiformis]|uniref:Uncharacterized protein n=1 Tax=Mollisia scopiformis TaxID=149040 RepID=A0A194X7E2_MOLSC|nr:uncharacterized protein LY89DRAFT_735234 [Mollisia scopiformis]KUJ16093.1 hypothetical protein LY89DRAFT_735234 [Mollisia scopiformis]
MFNEQQWLPTSELKEKLSTPRNTRIVINHEGHSKVSLTRTHQTTLDPATQLSKEVIAHLEDSKPAGIHIRNLGYFFDFIPSRLGLSKALDDSVRCILTAYTALLRRDAVVLRQDREEYYQAVKSLRIACADEKEALSDETLCAAVLLSWYEVLADNLDESWFTHISGTSHIIKLRGPARHRSGFGLALLKAQEGLISGEAMATFQPCFLDDPAWCEILDDQNMVVGLPQTAPLTVSNKILAQLSTLLLEARKLHNLSQKGIREIIKQLWGLRRTIKTALDQVTEMAEKDEEEFAPIICCKDSIYLILLDTTILKVLGFSDSKDPQLPETVQELQDLSLPPQTFTDVELFKQAIDSQIYQNFNTFLSNLALASKVTPFIMRKMAFMCRIMCVERGKREENPHPIWARYKRAISGVNEPDWLSRIIASFKPILPPANKSSGYQ